MLSKLLKELDFKQNIFVEDDETIKVNCKKNVIESVDTIINNSFMKTMYYIQKYHKEVFEMTKSNIENDIDDLCVFECDEYVEEVINYIKEEMKIVSESIIESLPEIQRK